MDLKYITKQLREHLYDLKDVFEKNESPVNKNDRAYFTMVKEKTLPVYDLLEQWEAGALKAVKERKINVHPHQVSSTKENMELLLMHSYYADARRKRYMELNHSVLYIFDQILREMNHTEAE